MTLREKPQPQIEYNIAPGNVIEVLGTKIKIEKTYGGGAVVDTHLGKIGKKPVVIREVRKDIENIPLEEDRKKNKDGFRSEALVLSKLNTAEGIVFDSNSTLKQRVDQIEGTKNSRNIAALLYSDDHIQIQEFAPGVFITSKHPGLRKKVFSRLLSAMHTSHQVGLSLHDFDPNSKRDRIQAEELATGINFKLIDFNSTGDLTKDSEAQSDIYYLIGHYLNIFADEKILGDTNYRDIESFKDLISELSESDMYFALSLYYLHAGLSGYGKTDSEKVLDVIPLLSKFLQAQENKDIDQMIQIYSNPKIVQSHLSAFLAKSAIAISPDNKIIIEHLTKRYKVDESIDVIFRLKIVDIIQALYQDYPERAIKLLNDDFISSEPGKLNRDILTCAKKILEDNQNSKAHITLANSILTINSAKLEQLIILKEQIANLRVVDPALKHILEIFEDKLGYKKKEEAPVIQANLNTKREFDIPLDLQANYRRKSLIRMRESIKLRGTQLENTDKLTQNLEESLAREQQLFLENQNLMKSNEEIIESLSKKTRETEELVKIMSNLENQLLSANTEKLRLLIENADLAATLQDLSDESEQKNGE